MKFRRLLLVALPSLLFVTSCDSLGGGLTPKDIVKIEKTGGDENKDIFTVTYDDGSTSTFEMPIEAEPEPEPVAKTFKEALADVTGRISLKGTLKEWAGDETALEGEGFDTSIDVSFTEDAYSYTSLDSIGQENSGTIFKMGDMAVQASINLKNELQFTPMVDDEDVAYDWSHYENPFGVLSIHDFVESETQPGVFNFRLDVPEVKEGARNFIARVSNYLFPDLTSAALVFENGKITKVTAETPVFETIFGFDKYQLTLDITGVGYEVGDIAYPTPKPTLEHHDKLRAALDELNKESFAAHYEQISKSYSDDPWEEADVYYNVDTYFTKYVAYLFDNDYEEGSGGIVVDGVLYNLTSPDGKTYERSYYPVRDDEGKTYPTTDGYRPLFNSVAAEHFTVIDDKHFEITGNFAGAAAYYYDVLGNPYTVQCTRTTIELDDNYKVKSIVATDDLFMRATTTITAIGEDVVLPFDVSEVTVQEDPFKGFIHTYECLEEDKATVATTITVASLEDVKVDGVAATDISFNGEDELTFAAGGLTYEIYLSSYSGTYSISVEGPNDYSEYYSSSEYSGNLRVL